MTISEMSCHCVLYFRQSKKNLTTCETVLDFLILIIMISNNSNSKISTMVF